MKSTMPYLGNHGRANDQASIDELVRLIAEDFPEIWKDNGQHRSQQAPRLMSIPIKKMALFAARISPVLASAGLGLVSIHNKV